MGRPCPIGTSRTNVVLEINWNNAKANAVANNKDVALCETMNDFMLFKFIIINKMYWYKYLSEPKNY